MENSPVWFITGCSTGFGNELARQVIAKGDRLVATARDKARLADLANGHDDTVLALDLDVTKPDEIEAAVAAAKAKFGRVDILVNNAGYGYMSTIEEGEEAEIRRQFDANVFGLFAMTRAILPLMRDQRSGHVINITSVAGIIGFPGSGYYATSKHAVEGFSDALAAEGKPLGIKVTCIEPGPFRTDWAGRSMTQTPNKIADYAETAGVRLAGTKQVSGKQPGDPARAAAAIIAIAGREDAPRHFVFGAFGVDQVAKRLNAALEEVAAWREAGLATDFPAE
ncbi:SDR family NAD(P)-dependent oxidoreductase [Rhizobium lusitanum]|uniref:SDR family NAD(P)-dependent oxidoreductase n=1 Tax=Rhizobium lusitanum TaxID=293958 RepID=A0A6L9UJH7_9HYPH|nr:oxidoreductase [Rhizobium lusitanum]NEI74522.1 SDR family NAD(P)-dependent oxidoreductase [Rhizobium lusitanum]